MYAAKDFYRSRRSTASIGELKTFLHATVGALGFPYFTYLGAKIPGAERKFSRFPFFISSYPESWIRRYVAGSYHLRDPIVSLARQRRSPFVWGVGDGEQDLPKKWRSVIREAREHGIERGITIPVHGPGEETGMLTIAGSWRQRDFNDAMDRSADTLCLLAQYTHQHAARSLRCEAVDRSVNLTGREHEILFWTAQGKTAWEISQIIHRSEPTVNYHIQRAMRKLEACNKINAVAKAACGRLISI